MANAPPLVTIAIPTYNRAAGFLRQSLQCAVDQTYPAIEIIVSDNCSSDGTEDLVRGFADPRIRYFRQTQNIGLRNNFNFCVEQARGAYFLLLPDDDLIDSDFVDVCLRAAHYESTIGLIRTGTRIIDGQGSLIYERDNPVAGLAGVDFFRAWFEGRISLYCCSSLVNTKSLRQDGGYRMDNPRVTAGFNLYVDVIVELRAASRYGRVDVPDIKASFRQHDEEYTAMSTLADWCESAFEMLDVMCDLVPEHREAIRTEGMAFFASDMYYRALQLKADSMGRRAASLFYVFRKFGYHYLPRKHFRDILVQNDTYIRLRRLKRSIFEQPGRIVRRVKKKVLSLPR
jgi:glycosyltransferase involved in cell wall biosynthesis